VSTGTHEPLLVVRDLRVSYNRVVEAVKGVDLTVEPGSITGIVGGNGAGKTTTLTAIAGSLAGEMDITGGSIVFDGRRIERERPDRVARLGIGLVPERKKIFANLKVDENLRASVSSREGAMSLAEAFDLFPSLANRRRLVAGYLSGGERQMLAIAMALVGGPKLMLVDEMSLGLSPAVVQDVGRVIRKLRDEADVSFLIVEQNAALALSLIDYGYVMQHGEIVLEGTRDQLQADRSFRDVYLGLDVDARTRNYRSATATAGAVEGADA
jgi:branched-chain amino acid transport system ATP-binding protein